VPSLAGFSKQKIKNRSAGQYDVSASCEGGTGNLAKLTDVISGHMTGIYVFSESSSVDSSNVSYNVSRYY